MRPLAPCPTCARHVRSDDAAYPFCGAEVPRADAPAGRVTAGAVSRAAMFAAGTAAVVGATDCWPTAEPLYGAPTIREPAFDATSESSSDDSGTADAGGDEGATLDGADGGG